MLNGKAYDLILAREKLTLAMKTVLHRNQQQSLLTLKLIQIERLRLVSFNFTVKASNENSW